MSALENTEIRNNSSWLDSGAQIAATLLWRDRRWLLPWLALIVLPGILSFASTDANVWLDVAALILSKLLALYVSFRIALRAHDLVPTTTPHFNPSPVRFVSIGIVLWLSWSFPLLIQLFPLSTPVDELLPIALVGLFVHYTYFFYPMGLLLGARTTREWLTVARNVTAKHRALPLRVIIPSSACMLISSALVLLPSVDGQIAAFSVASEMVAQLFWVVASYLTLGYGISTLPVDLGRLRAGGTATVESPSQPQQILQSILSMRVGLLLFWIGMFLWMGNMSLLMRTPPAVTMNVQTLEIQGKTLTLTLNLVDQKRSFQGFQPLQFVIAGENRELQSGIVETATLDDGTDVRLGFPAPRTTATVRLTFTTNRGGKELAQLEDLYLWYRWVKVAHLAMQTATVKEQNPEQTSAVGNP